MTKSRLPSRLGDGPHRCIGPAVNCTGSDRVLRKRPRLSRMTLIVARPSRMELYTKYFPSGVQAPQHSLAPRGLLPGANKGCRSLPLAETSHNVLRPLSVAVKRNTLASGDQRGITGSRNAVASPGNVTSLREPLPSALATNKPSPLL